MLARVQNVKMGGIPRNVKKNGMVNKATLLFSYCNRNDHTNDTCFKIHGYPSWFKDMVERQKGKIGSKKFANMENDFLTEELKNG